MAQQLPSTVFLCGKSFVNIAAQLQRIGNNVNQIVKQMHQTGSLYRDDVEEIKKILHDIWLSERRLLLKLK